jgi:hypothetical protein
MLSRQWSVVICDFTMLKMNLPLLLAFSSYTLKKSLGWNSPRLHFARGRPLSASISMDRAISRLTTLQTLLSKHGAPGSVGCSEANDLVPVQKQNLNLHPHLLAIAQSTKTSNYICALRRCYADDSEYESSSNSPWPIVESKEGSRGMKLLALNSEHLMRRIACENDSSLEEGKSDLVSIYNLGLGQGKLSQALDVPYEVGSVKSLGYGCDKYILLRVGPFPDLYETMALNHRGRGDESSSLIAAETSNRKLVGFGSTFAFYARLLNSFGARNDEARDAARMCLRLPLPSIGYLDSDWKEVAVLAQIADTGDSVEEALAKMQLFYEKIKSKENEEEMNGIDQGKTQEQMAIDVANDLLDRTALGDAKWASIRAELSRVYANAGKDDMAAFVIDPTQANL